MSKFFVPANNPEDWKALLAKPDRHWKTGYSAKALAYAWQTTDDFPAEVKKVFRKSDVPAFRHIKMLMAFPEYKVPLPGGKRSSQNDIFILAKGAGQLISITVEGKVDEPFGEPVCDWILTDNGGKQERLAYICANLNLELSRVDHIYYQLLHRTASAIVEAQKFNAPIALMLVHGFEKTEEKYKESLEAYKHFVSLFNTAGQENAITQLKKLESVELYSGWVRGSNKYLQV